MGTSGSKANKGGTLVPPDQKVRSLAEWRAMNPEFAKYKAELAKREAEKAANVQHSTKMRTITLIVVLVLILLVAAMVTKRAFG
jgi:hypothetical protein